LAVAPSKVKAPLAPVTELAASGALVARLDSMTVPPAFGMVTVLSAVGSVTASVVSNASAVAPSNSQLPAAGFSATVPDAFGSVMVRSAVGSVTLTVVS